jgi:outer membrane protein
MSKWRLNAALALALLAAGAAHAQSNLKIGVVNVAQLLEQAPQSAAVNDLLTREFQQRQSEILGLRQKLQTQTETFQRDSAVMGEEERVNLERQIRDGQRELQRTENEYLEDLNIRRNEEVSKLQRSLLQQVQAYARSAQYDIVLSDVLYFSSAVDITAAVLASMQREGGGEGARGGSGAQREQGGGRESRR